MPQTVRKAVIGHVLELRRGQRGCLRNSHDLVVKFGQTLTGLSMDTRHFIQHLSASFMLAVALFQVEYRFVIRPGRCVDNAKRVSAFILNGGEQANRLILIRSFKMPDEPFKLLFETGRTFAIDNGIPERADITHGSVMLQSPPASATGRCAGGALRAHICKSFTSTVDAFDVVRACGGCGCGGGRGAGAAGRCEIKSYASASRRFQAINSGSVLMP